MKKQIIGALVGSLILFFWQFLSWGLVTIHGPDLRYTPNQDAILEALDANLDEDGTYFLPRLEKGASDEDEQNYRNERLGKSWATVSYHKVMSDSFGMNLLRAWIIDFVAAFLLIWVLLRMANLDFMTALKASLAVGIIGYLTINYLNNIWFENGSIPYLIDAVVSWGIVGAWLGWWLPRS